MKKFLIVTSFFISITSFISAFVISDVQWSELLKTIAIILLLIGLRAAVPKPLIPNRRQ